MSEQNIVNSQISRLFSHHDESVNVIFRGRQSRIFESRFVRRNPGKAIIYISSQDGCSQGCRMCHLTATHQKFHENASLDFIIRQIDAHTTHLKNIKNIINTIHINFMARGEPLDNPLLLKNINHIEEYILRSGAIADFNCEKKILFSTIFPNSFHEKNFKYILNTKILNIYYSIYSTNPEFRKKWLPKALPVKQSLELMRIFSEKNQKTPTVHFCFIRGQNDAEKDIISMSKLLNEVIPRCKINIVRFNPPERSDYHESPHEVITKSISILKNEIPNCNIKVVERVGFDVKASCGMFVTGDEFV